MMVRVARWFTIGATSAILFAVGCSSNTPTSSTTAEPSVAAETTEAESTETETADATAEGASPSEAGAEKASSRPVEGVTLQPGTDPLAMVFATRSPSSDIAGTELIRVAYPTPEKAVVTIIKTGLLDDSVAATRTRYDFKPVEGSVEAAKQWQLVRVTEQNKCQPNRGAQDWTGDLCQ